MIPSFFGDSRPRARFSRFIYSNGWIFWLLICLTVLVSMPDMVSGNLLPKTFWATITVGIGFLLLPPRHPRRFSITPLGIIWIGYLFWTLLSAAWALSPRVVYDRWLALLLPTFAYLIAKRTRFWKSDKFWLGFSLLTGLVALIGISQYFFPSFPFINSLPGTAVPRATMGNRNYAGMYFMLVLPFLGWIYFKTAGKTRLPVSLSFFLAVTLILIVRTRGAWLGLIVGSGFILVGIFDRKKRTAAGYDRIGFYKKKLYWIITLIISLLIINAVYTPKTKQSLIKTITHFFNDPTRWGYWKSCLGITGPIVGCGFGNFPITITPELRTGQVETLNFDVHNDYLQAYLDLGIPGLLIFILFFGYLFYLAWRGRRQSIILAAGAAVAGLLAMQFTTFLSEKISSQIWLAGVVAMINSQGKVRPVFCKTAPRWLTYSGNYAAATGLFVFAVVVGYAIRGDLTFRETQKMIIQYYDDARLVEGAGN
ncbi:MAG: O-antigen ligase family protein, partial [Elusimicrobiota bacterium]|nr:O-antigen ligase family protein [Elusimicrobiota bacterium]